jgi:hypothetical protein
MRIRNRKLLPALVVIGVAGALSGLAAAGSSSVSVPQVGSNVVIPAEKATAMANRMPSAATDASTPAGTASAPPFAPEPIPAKILGPDVPVPVSASIINVANAWLVSNGYDLVAVYAGSAANDSTQGRVVIVRQSLAAGKQTVQIVNAGSTGALSVAPSAPSGAAVETSALTGSVDLRTSSGAIERLNLSTNAISAK